MPSTPEEFRYSTRSLKTQKVLYKALQVAIKYSEHHGDGLTSWDLWRLSEELVRIEDILERRGELY